jgi:hypothetical protein
LNRSSAGDAHVFGAYERAIPRPGQEFGINQRTEERIARGPVEPPEALRLCRRQTQPWHFDVLTAYAPEHIVMSLL